jgi:hypothetical protein
MRIQTRRSDPFIEVKVVDGGTTIHLGLLTWSASDELAESLLSGVWDLGPRGINIAAVAWFKERLQAAGIEL